MNITETFKAKFGLLPDFTVFTPYRICPVGAHVDHNLGKITGFAIDKGIHIACSETDGLIDVISLQFEGRQSWNITDTPAVKQGDWADHLRGAVIALGKTHTLKKGIISVIDGELPIGGLSSSAAVIIGFINALCTVNDITLTDDELISISRSAEYDYVGVKCGLLDQSCEVCCKKDKLLTIDLYDNSRELLPKNEKMADFDILIFFSGLERSLASSDYNNRIYELRSAAYALKSLAGMEYTDFSQTNMRQVPYEVYLQYKEQIAPEWAKRAEHWFSEMQRVEDGISAWKRGDIEAFGKISAQSGHSSIVNWEAGSPELIKLHEIINSTSGIYGGRFSGAGFKGCAMALSEPSKRNSILDEVKEKYTSAFPDLKDKYTCCVCKTADGVGK